MLIIGEDELGRALVGWLVFGEGRKEGNACECGRGEESRGSGEWREREGKGRGIAAKASGSRSGAAAEGPLAEAGEESAAGTGRGMAAAEDFPAADGRRRWEVPGAVEAGILWAQGHRRPSATAESPPMPPPLDWLGLLAGSAASG